MIGQVRYGSLDLTDAPYVTGPASDMGSPAPDQATVARLLADGDVVGGIRYGNRHLSLRVTIAANSRAEFAAAEQALFVEAGKPTNTLTVLFGDGDGLPVVFDTYRGELTPDYDNTVAIQYARSYTLTCPAEPFVRSPDLITIDPTSTSTVIDGFDSLTGLTTSETATLDTTTFVTSTGSVKQPITVEMSTGFVPVPVLSVSWSRSVGPLNLSADTSVRLWLMSDYPWVSTFAIGARLTLSSSGGKSSTWQTAGFAATGPGWQPVAWDLTAAPVSTVAGGVNLAAVTGWAVELGPQYSIAGSGPFTIWADDLRAYPHGSAEVTAGSAILFFAGIEGAARTPVTVEVDASAPSGGLILANTPNPPVGYDPVLRAVDGTTTTPFTVSRKAVTLRRPDCSTYIVVLYADLAADTYTAEASISTDPTGTVSSCSRVIDLDDPEFDNTNAAGYALFSIGELTLPPTDVDPQNTGATVDITITSGTTVRGAWLVWAGGENLQAFLRDTNTIRYWFLDAPTPGQVQGRLLGSSSTRAAAYDMGSVRDGMAVVNFTPGANHLLAVALPPDSSPNASPSLTASLSYYSRWLTERTS